MFKGIFTAALVMLAGSTAAQAVVLFSDDFNVNSVGANRTPIGWTTTGGAVDIVASYTVQGRQIDLDSASSLAPAVIQTNAIFNFTAGHAYRISFDYGKRSNTMEVLTFGTGGFGSGIFSFGAALPTMLGASFTFLATSNFSSSLFFSGYVGNSRGLVVDNIKLETLTPVPVPPAGFLLAAGLFGVSALGRRRDG